jgi:hypothetical protein
MKRPGWRERARWVGDGIGVVGASGLVLLLAALGVGMVRAGLHEVPAVLLPAGLLCLLGAFAIARGLARSFRSRGRRERVDCNDRQVSRHMVDGREETIAWGDLAEVKIVTTDEGPWVDDVYWLLIDGTGTAGCAVPGSAEGHQELLRRLQELPGFDNEQVVRAMGSTTNAEFVCWRRPPIS